jgi:hypothetical protein
MSDDKNNFACSNHLCSNHFPLQKNESSSGYFLIQEGDKAIQIKRFLYRSFDGKTEFHLCKTCHEAAQLVAKGGQS